MQYSNQYEYLLGHFDEEIVLITRYLASNSATGIEDYRRLCGVIQGLNLAKNIVNDLAKRQEDDADE